MKTFGALAAMMLMATAAQAENTNLQTTMDAMQKDWAKAVDAQDATAIANMFVPDGVFVNAAGTVAHGRDEIAKLYAKSIEREGHLELKSDFQIAVGPDTFVSVNDWKGRADGGHSVVTVTKTPEGWRYVAVAPYIVK